jgi:4-alpha-glucanotransferase
MKVLQFGFSNPGAHIYLPHRFTPDSVVYTGTHDNDTTLGWWNAGASDRERDFARAYLGATDDGIHWAFIRAAQASVASLCVVPLQDVLGLASEARMNVPSKIGGNWSWRHQPGALRGEIAQRLSLLAEITDRVPVPLARLPQAAEFAA